MRIIAGFFVVALFLCSSPTSADTVYRYKDDRGRWQFSDKEPKQKHESLVLSSKNKSKDEPRLILSDSADGKVLMSVNPWFAPVTFSLLLDGKTVHSFLAEAKSNKPVFESKDEALRLDLDKLSYRYLLGKVIQGPDGKALRPPIPELGKFMVTQGFNGSFSHNTEGSKYAVDIAMNVDDHVHAARDGKVVFVKDDYHMGGTDKFFLDKANQITVIHSDGTFAVYGHILLGSALVKPGDNVKAGDALANTGTSGYSTGPHLHFVLRYNNGEKIVSSPFEFIRKQGKGEPKYKQWLQVVPN